MFNVFNKFKVSVTNRAGDVNVVVDPKPVCTEEKYIPAVQKTIQHILFRHQGEAYTPMVRAKIKKELSDQLEFFYKQRMIRPFELGKDDVEKVHSLDEESS